MATKNTKKEETLEQETPKIDVTEVPETKQAEEAAEAVNEETTAEEAPKKKYGPIDYVEKAIQLLKAEKPCENYTTALKMLDGAQIFIKKEVG